MRAGKLRNCLGFTLFFLTRHSLLATSQASHSTALGRNTVLEPAHYHTETISASTREEDLAQHVQAGTETSTTTASQHTQDSPHMITKSAEMAAAIATDEILHQTATTKGHWGEKNTTAGSSSGKVSFAIPQLELVVARNMEKVEWLSRVPNFWQVTILNKVTKDARIAKLPRGRRWNVVNAHGISSDSEAFAYHLVNRYDSLAEYTVFSPARPLQVNGRFIELLSTPTKLGNVQALSGKPIGRASNTYATDRISTRTLNSVLTHDPDSVEIAKWFSKDYNLTWGQNLVKKYFDMIGLADWMDERQEIGSAAPLGLLGVERSRITRHSKTIYENLLGSIPVFGGNTHVVDRIWLMLFAGSDFQDVLT